MEKKDNKNSQEIQEQKNNKNKENFIFTEIESEDS